MRSQIATNQTELARLCGVAPATISRHVDSGVVPVGEVQLGKRKYYSPGQVEVIVRYFKERAKGETLGKYTYDVSDKSEKSRQAGEASAELVNDLRSKTGRRRNGK